MEKRSKAIELSLAVTVFLLMATTSAAFCGKLGAFDAMCLKDGAVFIISISPCHGKNLPNKIDRAIYLTIIDSKNKTKKYDFIEKEAVRKPKSFGRSDVGFLLEMHYHSGGSSKGYLHVDLSLGNFSDDGIHSKKKLLDLMFYIGNAGFCFGEFSGASHYASPKCQVSKRTGNLSTLCITRQSSSVDKKGPGIFFVSVDPCTSPFSYWVVALFPSRNIQIIERFTASKTDMFVPVDSTESPCGFKIKYRQDHKTTLTAVIELLYGCNDSTAVHLVNDYYFPDPAVMCPQKSCKAIAEHRRVCETKMIVGREQSVNLTFDVQMAGCNEKYSVFAVLTMEGVENKLYMNFLHSEQWHDFKFDGVNRTEPSNQVIKPVKSGFIPQFGGYIMVISERLHFSFDDFDEETKKTTHNSVTSAFLIIDRYYGEINSSTHILAPLVWEMFSLPACSSGGGPSKRGRPTLSGAVIAVISLSVIAVVAVLAAFVFCWRRNRRKEEGLPYKIELNYDAEEENDL